jgi:hypothetical protein
MAGLYWGIEWRGETFSDNSSPWAPELSPMAIA